MRIHVVPMILVSGTAFLAAAVQAPEPKAPREAAPRTEPEMAIVQTGPEHTRLAKRVGTWDVTLTTAEDGGSESTFKGVDRSRMLGGRWLISDFEADFMGSPFQGHGVMGYDPLEKKYVQTWVDTGSERAVHSQGSYDESGRTLTMKTESRDPSTRKSVEEKHVSRWIDDDTMVFEMYRGGEGHPMVLKVEYKRRK